MLYSPTQIVSPWSLQNSNFFQQWKWYNIFVYLSCTFIHSFNNAPYILGIIVDTEIQIEQNEDAVFKDFSLYFRQIINK